MEALLGRIQDRIGAAVEWSAQIVFHESGAVLPLKVTLKSVEEVSNLPHNTKYNPRAILRLCPLHNSCIRFPADGIFRLVISCNSISGSSSSRCTIYDQWATMSQLRAQASM